MDADDYDWLMQWRWYAMYVKAAQSYYAIRNGRKGESKRAYLLHRQLLGEPDSDVDHWNGVTLDCRRSNLRSSTKSQNIANRRRHKNNSSGYAGVYWYPQQRKWRAEIWVHGKQFHLGFFADKDEAIAARLEAEKHFFGVFRVDTRRVPPSVSSALSKQVLM